MVYLGRQMKQSSSSHEVNRTIVHIISHPSYNSYNGNNDISLLKLSSPVNFTNYIRPICLADSNSTFYNGTMGWLTGWGNVDLGGGRYMWFRLDMFSFFFFPKIQMKLCLFFRASSSTSEPDGGEHPSGGEQRVRLCVWQGLYQRHDDVCRVTGGQERPLSCNVFCQFVSHTLCHFVIRN